MKNELKQIEKALNQVETNMLEDFKRMKRHIGIMYFFNDYELQPDSYRDITDPLFKMPTVEEITAVVNDLIKCGYSKTDICGFMGVIPDKTKDKTKWLRKWMNDGSISYCHWQVLLSLAGKKFIANIIPETGWSHN